MQKQIYTLLLLLIFITSCNGQTKTPSKEIISEPTIIRACQPKLVKTQPSTVYDNIHCCLLDHTGNLWFGIGGANVNNEPQGQGVYRYDGKTFTNFTVNEGLSHNSVYSILEDKSGKIWVGTHKGVCVYDGNKFTTIPITVAGENNLHSNNSPANDRFLGNDVYSLLQDRTGKIWLGTTGGVYCYDGTSFSRFLGHDSVINKSRLTLKSVQCMLEDKNGNIWFGSGPMAFEGLCCYDGKSIVNFKPGGQTWIRYLLEDKGHNILIGTRNQGMWRYDGKTFSKFLQGSDSEHVNNDMALSALVDRSGNIWLSGGENDNGFGGDGGIWRVDGKSFRNFTTKDGLGDYSVWCMVEDRDGNIWVGTRNTGLHRFDGKTFTSFTEN